MAKPMAPEPKFFRIDSLYERGLGYYAATWFDGLGARVLGEKSTSYLEEPRVAGRMHRDLPDVRLIFILRDPVERAWSNYCWSRHNGLETESFAYAIAHEDERAVPERLRDTRPFSYVARGRYADLLAPYFALFPRDRILVLKFEDLRQGAAPLTARVHRFIGVAERPGDADGMGVVNPAQGADQGMPEACRRRLTELFAESNRDLERLVLQDFSAWRGDDGHR